MNKLQALAVVVVVAALAAAFWWASPRQTDASSPTAPPPEAPAETYPVWFAMFPPVADRFVDEPCNRVGGAGFYSLGAAMKDLRKHDDGAIGVSLGDLTLAEGGVGKRVANFLYTTVFPKEVTLVAAGEGELGTGVEMVRESLTRAGPVFLCANAVDAKGQPLMRGFQLAKSGGRGVMIVAVAADSLQAELVRRGSDVRIAPAQKAVEQAHAEGLAQAARTNFQVDVFALIVHGTVEEAAAIVEKTPGVTFAVAAHGAVLPDAAPRVVNGAPIVYGGQGLRFYWALVVPPNGRAVEPELMRVGGFSMALGSEYGEMLKYLREAKMPRFYDEANDTPGDRLRNPRGAYVGGARCSGCHVLVASEFAGSAHAKPPAALLASPFNGTTGCVNCHQTGPYATGGWKGPRDTTSDMAGVSCEACHGPGEIHAATPKTAKMPKVGLERCVACHLPDRDPDFDAAALWKRCGHKLLK